MKYLVVLAVIAVALWIWRNGRIGERDASPPRRPPAVPGPQAMLRCAHCGVHLPATDAVTGRRGGYCSDAHRLAAESGKS